MNALIAKLKAFVAKIQIWLKGEEKTFHIQPDEKVAPLIAKVKQDNLMKSLFTDADYMFVPVVDVTNLTRASNEAFSSKIEDQLTLGSCTANSTTSACESVENTVRPYQPGVTDLSRLFVYETAQKVDGIVGDNGATIKGALTALTHYGAPRETDFPYDTSKYGQVIPQATYDLAAARKVNRYERINVDKNNWPSTTHAMVQSALAEGLRVVMGFDVYNWMFHVSGPMSTHGTQPGALNAGDPLLNFAGRHAIYVEGFDKNLNPASGGSYILRNSWGTAWGDQGRWAMPWTNIMSWAFEFWVIRSFADATVGQGTPPAPLTAAQIAQGRQYLADHGIGTYDATTQTYTYVSGAPVGDFFAAGTAKKLGYTAEQYASIINVPASSVKSFMETPTNIPLINAYSS